MITVKQVAAMAVRSQSTVLRAIDTGTISASKMGGVWFVSTDEAARFAQSLESERQQFDEFNLALKFVELHNLRACPHLIRVLEESFELLLLKSRFRQLRGRDGFYRASSSDLIRWIKQQDTKRALAELMQEQLDMEDRADWAVAYNSVLAVLCRSDDGE